MKIKTVEDRVLVILDKISKEDFDLVLKSHNGEYIIVDADFKPVFKVMAGEDGKYFGKYGAVFQPIRFDGKETVVTEALADIEDGIINKREFALKNMIALDYIGKIEEIFKEEVEIIKEKIHAVTSKMDNLL